MKITSEEIIIEKLKKEHDLSKFNSYEEDLVEFIREDALDNQNMEISLTFVLKHKGEIAGYITLLTDRIDLKGDLKEKFMEKEIYYKSLPAIKIGRLCVDDKYLRQGLGRLMINLAIFISKSVNNHFAGCRFITLDAKKGEKESLNPIQFYEKHRFKVIREEKETISMYLDLGDINI